MADVILPATSFAEKDGTFTNTDRRVQRCRAAVAPVGDSRPDWDILSDLGRRIEAAAGRPADGRLRLRPSRSDLGRDAPVSPPTSGASTTPASNARAASTGRAPAFDHPGTPFLFSDDFPRGRGKFWEVEYGTDSEQPDEEYPFNLSTGRVLYHWHGSTMTGRSRLEDVYPEAVCEMHPDDAATLGLETGDWVTISSRRGAITLRVLVTGRSPQGTVFVPFHFAEAAANMLTLDRIDERAKIPDYKNTAVKIEKTAAPEGWDEGYDKRPVRPRSD